MSSTEFSDLTLSPTTCSDESQFNNSSTVMYRSAYCIVIYACDVYCAGGGRDAGIVISHGTAESCIRCQSQAAGHNFAGHASPRVALSGADQ